VIHIISVDEPVVKVGGLLVTSSASFQWKTWNPWKLGHNRLTQINAGRNLRLARYWDWYRYSSLMRRYVSMYVFMSCTKHTEVCPPQTCYFCARRRLQGWQIADVCQTTAWSRSGISLFRPNHIVLSRIIFSSPPFPERADTY
jgi:hypothetical protein